jgi:hypothetical protein
MKNVMWFIAVVVFGVCLLKSCGFANEGNSVKGKLSSDESFIDKFSEDHFVGEWHGVENKVVIIKKLSIKYDGENYILSYKIGDEDYGMVTELILQKKNSLLLEGYGVPLIRYDKNSKHIFFNLIGTPMEFCK